VIALDAQTTPCASLATNAKQGKGQAMIYVTINEPEHDIEEEYEDNEVLSLDALVASIKEDYPEARSAVITVTW
jgi:hypothetical protein